MSQNYDDADLVALKIIERITKNQAVRQTKERKEELNRVMKKIEHIYREFEHPTLLRKEFSNIAEAFAKSDFEEANVEYVPDMAALEKMINNEKWRDSYMRKITLFVVGNSNMAKERLTLLQEINQFFVNNEDALDWFIKREKVLNSEVVGDSIVDKQDSEIVIDHEDEEDYSVEELSGRMKDAMDSCQKLTDELGRVNGEMVDWLVKYAQNKGGAKNRKKLEKSLESVMSECRKLQEKLIEMDKTVNEKNSKIDHLVKQLEVKTSEMQKHKSTADSFRKSVHDIDILKEKLKHKDENIIKLEVELEQYKLKIEEIESLSNAKLKDNEDANAELLEKYNLLEKAFEDQKLSLAEDKRKTDNEIDEENSPIMDIKRKHAADLNKLKVDYQNSVQQLKLKHQQEIEKLQSELEQTKTALETSSEFDENAIVIRMSDTEDESARSLSKNPSGMSDRKGKDSQIGSSSAKSSAKSIMEFNDFPNLDDEGFWASVPRNETVGRFQQFRQLARDALRKEKMGFSNNEQITERQLLALKSQHQEHRRRWDLERDQLMNALHQVESERNEARNLAESVASEMESLIEYIQSPTPSLSSQKNNEKLTLSVFQIVEMICAEIQKEKMKNDELDRLLQELTRRCKQVDEKSRLSLPKFSTMIELTRKGDSRISYITDPQPNEPINENRDIPLPPDDNDDERKTKDACVAASPSLLEIAFTGTNMENIKITSIMDEGVTSANLITPNGMIDIQDQTGLSLIKHPIVTDYLSSYDSVLTFKEKLISALENIEKSDPADILALNEMKPISIRSQHRIIPQIEAIRNSIDLILRKSTVVMEKLLLNKNPQNRQSTQPNTTQKTQTPTSKTRNQIIVNAGNAMTLLVNLKDMKEEMMKIQRLFLQKFNVVSDSINQARQLTMKFQQEINSQPYLKHQQDSEQMPKVESRNSINTENADHSSISILFTRRDLERNVRKLETEKFSKRMNDLLYEEAVQKMSDYLEIPVQRLQILVKKYVHKKTMDNIAEYVQKNNKFSSSLFQTLNEMESFSEKRTRRYDDIEEYLHCERLLRAQQMNNAFDKLQNESTVILIRPILSRAPRRLLSDVIEQNQIAQKSDALKQSIITEATRKPEPDNLSLLNGSKLTWNPVKSLDGDGLENITSSSLSNSRLAEIDTNRMLLPVNNVSQSYSTDSTNTNMLPPQVAVRNYVAVAHPTMVDVQLTDAPTALSCRSAHSPSPENDVSDQAAIDQSSSALDAPPNSFIASRMSRDLSKHTPLPPIVSTIMDD